MIAEIGVGVFLASNLVMYVHSMAFAITITTLLNSAKEGNLPGDLRQPPEYGPPNAAGDHHLHRAQF